MGGLEVYQRIRQIDARIPVIFVTQTTSTDTAIEAMRRGAFEYLFKPLDLDRLEEVVTEALEVVRLMREPTVVTETASPAAEDIRGDAIVGRCPAMGDVYKAIGRVADQNVIVLINGESGTGKELVARAIYHHSERADKPFLAINCAAIPEQLLESELFGHERGAFTGAAMQRIGRFEQCHQGTIFLDEIGDMTPATQTKILRVLQSGTFERVGGNQPIRADVRVIAATNKPLEQAVAARQFREDLFYRLNVVRIQLPPLRERPEDVRLLVNYFLKKHEHDPQQSPKSISASVIKTLEKYHWPGNVRELENVMQRAVVVAKGDVILPGDLPPELVDPGGHASSAAQLSPGTLAVGEGGSTEMSSVARLMFR